uniref:Uncharacterized protein n=1 Tax=Rhizophora mucronata TaxID=61149 RepID=A0A2P2IXW4_RHIMU
MGNLAMLKLHYVMWTMTIKFSASLLPFCLKIFILVANVFLLIKIIIFLGFLYRQSNSLYQLPVSSTE